MTIYPAIDLFEGKAVRLLRGDYGRMTVYGEDPVGIALRMKRQGAACLHVVDLEGARDGTQKNLPLVGEIIAATGLFVQTGGGVRSHGAIEACLSRGAARVVLGTRALTDEAFLEEALRLYGEKIAVGVDLAGGRAMVSGWTRAACAPADELFGRLADRGARTVICTDISRDGALAGMDLPLYRKLARAYAMDIVASGGASSPADVRALREAGVRGLVIGKAFYEGTMKLQEALEAAQ